MAGEVAVPTFPESVTDGTLVSWRKRPGEAVKRGEVLADVETDKVVFEVPAAQDGVLQEIVVPEGTTVTSGQVIGRIGAGAPKPVAAPKPEAEPKPAAVAAPATQRQPARSVEAAIMPSARRAMAERGLERAAVSGSGRSGRILKEDVLKQQAEPPARQAEPVVRAAEPAAIAAAAPSNAVVELPGAGAAGRPEKRVPMTRLRARIAQRLVEAQHTAAILTTFNEVNMQPVMDLRNRYRDAFEREHKVKLGFMSFFVKASIEALKRFPEVNASVEGTDIIYHSYYDIGIAVGSPRGLVVPIVRDADRLDMAAIELRIKEYGEKANSGTLALADITGGTFTISNGGIFGSLVSTPILNPPQSAILGMHKIEDRPVAENGVVVIRPMMYLALSYDHRIVDGREAVRFLVTIKEMIEDPARLVLGV